MWYRGKGGDVNMKKQKKKRMRMRRRRRMMMNVMKRDGMIEKQKSLVVRQKREERVMDQERCWKKKEAGYL